MPNLTIILGAGASAGLNINKNALDSQIWRPPLVSDIFRNENQYRAILRKYPRAETLVSSIEIEIKRGVNLETVLKKYDEECKAKKNVFEIKQYLEIPLYLNEIFCNISTLFTSKPDEFNALVNEVLKVTDEVLFLTTNYDTILEIPLSRIFNVDFSKESHYLNKKWALVKIHGSTNWYKKFNLYTKQTDYFTLLEQSPYPLPLDEEYILVPRYKPSTKFFNGVPVYPCITNPVDGKYDLNCPQSHIGYASEFLKKCQNYLFIGSSCRDKDLLDLLKSNVAGGKVSLIDISSKITQENIDRLIYNVPQLTNIFAYENINGLTLYIQKGHLDKFLKQLI